MKNMLQRMKASGGFRAANYLFFINVANGATAPTGVLDSAQKVVDLACVALLWMFWGLLVLSVAMFLVGGYGYATAAGDPEKVGKANRTLLYAAIGIVVALIARGVPSVIGSFLVPGANLTACP